MSALQISLTLTDASIEALAELVGQRVNKRIFGALAVATGPSRTLTDVHTKASVRSRVKAESVHTPLDPTMAELAINSAISKSENGIRSVRSIEVSKALSSPGALVTSKQVELAWEKDGRFDLLGRGWYRVKLKGKA